MSVEPHRSVPGLCGAPSSSGQRLPVLLQVGDDVTLQTEHGGAGPVVLLAVVLEVGQGSDAHVSQLWRVGERGVEMANK